MMGHSMYEMDAMSNEEGWGKEHGVRTARHDGDHGVGARSHPAPAGGHGRMEFSGSNSMFGAQISKRGTKDA